MITKKIGKTNYNLTFTGKNNSKESEQNGFQLSGAVRVGEPWRLEKVEAWLEKGNFDSYLHFKVIVDNDMPILNANAYLYFVGNIRGNLIRIKCKEAPNHSPCRGRFYIHNKTGLKSSPDELQLTFITHMESHSAKWKLDEKTKSQVSQFLNNK